MVKIIKSRDRELIDNIRNESINSESRLIEQMESKLFTSFGHEKSVYSELFELLKRIDRRLMQVEQLVQA